MRFHRLRVLRRLPHPGRGFTQGLIVSDGIVWESTGEYGQSALRRYQLGVGQMEACAMLPPELFAEGICQVGGAIWQLTWQERTALRWHPDSLELLATVPYNREGWGICEAGECLMTSDGSSELVRRNPQTLAPLGIVKVRCEGERVAGLNDLAWAAGRIWANILARPYLAGIDPSTGEVTDIVDARRLGERHWRDPQAVLNGIAPLPADGEFLLTGKRWRFIYHVALVPGRDRGPAAELLAPATG
jgi:glutaminyl-peptide cyclotransferase